MSKGWDRTRLTEFCAQAGLAPHEEQFVHTVVRLMSTDGVLADTALATRTASFTVPWAESLLSAFRRGKLHASHVHKALDSAIAACARLTGLGLPLNRATAWLSSLHTAQNNLAAAPGTNANRADVDQHMLEIVRVVLGPVPPSSAIVETLAAEVAQGLVSRSADADEYLTRLRALDTGDPSFRANLADALIFRERAHMVLVPVNGARRFISLSTVDPSVDVRQVLPGGHRTFAGWGDGGNQARQFSEHRLDVLEDDAVLSVRVAASGPRAAAYAARRTVLEVLDRYVASHPWVDFEVGPTFGVGIPGTPLVRPISLLPPVEDVVRPLAINWPDELRAAIRMVHLLRKQPTPITQVSLAWVALESAGIAGDKAVERVAKILALAFLRQRAFNSYRLVVQDALDRGRERACRQRGENLPKLAKRRRARAARPGVPPEAAHALRVRAAADDLLGLCFTRLGQLHRTANSAREDWFTVLESSVQPAAALPLPNRAYLHSLSSWTRLLAEPWETSTRPAAEALRNLINAGSTATRTAVTDFGTSARDGVRCVELLTDDREWAQTLLTMLNSGRNLHLHSGTFTAEGELALGRLAVLIPDLLFEVWSTWYSTPSNTNRSPQNVVTVLAKRYDTCVDKLNAGAALADGDLNNVTGPNWRPLF